MLPVHIAAVEIARSRLTGTVVPGVARVAPSASSRIWQLALLGGCKVVHGKPQVVQVVEALRAAAGLARSGWPAESAISVMVEVDRYHHQQFDEREPAPAFHLGFAKMAKCFHGSLRFQ